MQRETREDSLRQWNTYQILSDRVTELAAALREADARLREHGDTSLHPVRERIWRLLGEPTVDK